jgi:hypothetical protein
MYAELRIGERGGNRGNQYTNANDNNINNANPRVAVGTTAAESLRRLHKHSPALYQRVVAGELSPHRAAVLAGQ